MADESIDFDIKFRDLFSGTLNKANKQINDLNNSLKSTQEAAKGFSVVGMAMGSFVGNLATQAVGGIMDLGKGILKLGMDAEQTQTAFTTMMGDAGKASAHIADIKKLAAQTPYELEPLLNGSRMLQQYGMSAKRATAMMSMLGDVASGDANKLSSLNYAMAQINAAGTLQGQDLRQLIDAGFNPLAVMAEKTGKSMAELKEDMSKGAISADMVTQALIDVTSAGGNFFNMSEKQSKTVAGRLSTMIDDLKEVGRQIGATLLPALGWMIDHFKTIAKTLAVLTVAFAAYKTIVFFSTMSTISFTGAFAALNAVMKANPIGVTITILASLALTFIWLWDVCEGFRGMLYGLWEALKMIGLNILYSLVEPLKSLSLIWDGLSDLFNGKGLDKLIEGFKMLGRTIFDFLVQPLLQAVKIVDKIAGTDYAKSFKESLGMKTDITAGTGRAFDKGYKDGVDSMKEKKDTLTINKQDALSAGTNPALATGKGGKDPLKGEVDKIKSNQPSNININIDTLVKVDNIGISNASNPKSDMNNFLNQLEEALLTVVNDVNYVLK